MPVVNLPSQLVVAEDSWAASDNRIIQRSAFTAAAREIVLGPASLWTCEAEIVARDVDELLPIRAFLAQMAQPDHWCLLTIAGIGQLANLPGIPNSCQVNGAGQLGTALNVDGLTPSVLNLRAGMGITEETDAIALVVSEETGALSLCYQGKLEHDLEPDDLRQRINEILAGDANDVSTTHKDKEDSHELGHTI